MSHGIIWLEANANRGLTDPCTSRHLAELLSGISERPVLFRHAHAPAEIAYHLRRAKATRWPVVYLTAHGEPGRLLLDRWTTLDTLGKALAPQLRNRVLHCSSCSLMKDRVAARKFRKTTGLRMLSGFSTDVPWLDCSAFELMLMDMLTYIRMPQFLRASMKVAMPSLVNELEWVLFG